MTTDIAALIGSRICHDLISPIGAIGNGVELLAMSPSVGPSAELDLITQSVQNANARIRFFRIAFGAAKGTDQIGTQEIVSVLTEIAKGGRFTFDWQVQGPMSRRDVRLAFLLIQCIETALPLGGDMQVTQHDDDWTITAHGRRVMIDDALWNSLHGAPYDHKPAQVQFAYVPTVAQRAITVSHTDANITIRF